MGITGRFAMPLLSTLAALVIIVHSAEEDYDKDSRYALRPRVLDTGTPSYDQSWRNMKGEPIIHPHSQEDDSSDLEEPMKRRRPVRKRKRRPIASSEDLIPQERNVYPEEQLSYQEPEYNTEQPTNAPRRRRKKLQNRPSRWTEESVEIERPVRRRNLRRKRPTVNPWPPLSEFNDYRPQETTEIDKEKTEFEDPLRVDYNIHESSERLPFLQDQEYDNGDEKIKEVLTDPSIGVQGQENYEMHLKQDKSLSEFSMEETPDSPTGEQAEVIRDKMGEKSSTIKAQNKARKTQFFDPIALKDILKRSNGTSLSELLQQHNLSLADLLHGNENAISILQLEEPLGSNRDTESKKMQNIQTEKTQKSSENISHISTDEREDDKNERAKSKEKLEFAIDKTDGADFSSSNKNESSREMLQKTLEKQNVDPNSEEKLEVKENGPRIVSKRFPVVRRKLRMRPALNNTYKGQLNRDLMALTARKYQHNRNSTKSKEWRLVIPTIINITESNEHIVKKDLPETTTIITTTSEETTILPSSEYVNPTTVAIDQQESNNNQNEIDILNANQPPITETPTEIPNNITEKPKVSRFGRPPAGRLGLRRQAFNNRLKRKRLKQKNSTTEPPTEQDNFMTELFGMPNLVSSSEFIARTQTPAPTDSQDSEEVFTTLEDFITTEASNIIENTIRTTSFSTTTSTTSVPKVTPISSTTEETAKVEIEEILNDTRTSARLSKILMERNMTLSELVEHRERGSSHVHLADIFHNASKEPNPPEPFLSKSSIEPISKEIYPLRALLEANLHDPTAKATTIDPNQQTQSVNIPVVMDFGNNVNENGENLGIMSLFNKFAEKEMSVEKSAVKKDSDGTPYVTTVFSVDTDSVNTTRESRVLKDDKPNLKQDLVGWNELFTLMHNNHINETENMLTSITNGLSPLEPKKNVLDEDSDGDGLVVLEDLQHLKDFDSNIASVSNENLELNTYQRTDLASPVQPGILDQPPSHARSVTVATASIVGLAMILFLLTYAAFKWKQQRQILHNKQNLSNERIPAPVFEHRKGHKNNCSTRSISPMLASSNIYTMNTLDSHTGKESPDYMWDSLRKPFQ